MRSLVARALARRLLACAVLLVVSALAPVLGAEMTLLGQVMDNRSGGLSVEVRGTRAYYGPSIDLVFTNETGSDFVVEVPVGMLLVPADPAVQTMVTLGGEQVTVPPGSSRHRIIAFCGEEHPDGHLKLPHLWPGQTPPPPGGGTGGR